MTPSLNESTKQYYPKSNPSTYGHRRLAVENRGPIQSRKSKQLTRFVGSWTNSDKRARTATCILLPVFSNFGLGLCCVLSLVRTVEILCRYGLTIEVLRQLEYYMGE